MNKTRAHMIVKGRVQGVFFRATTRTQAQSLGITGWVKNRSDGNVEIMAEGEEVAVANLIQWCHQGPPGAKVDSVDLEWEECEGEFVNFSIRYTDRW